MHVIALTTCPGRKSAEKISDAILKERLAACVSIIPGLKSSYWWKGSIESGKEMLLLMKTRKDRVRQLEKAVKENHPYELCEFLVIPAEGSKEYLRWIDEETGHPQ
jgi:periplasmic divalent cation tolerance protein